MSLTGCVTENVRVVPKKVSVDAGIDFNPCGSDVEGYQFSPQGIITISCTNGMIYSVRNRDELKKLKKNVNKCQENGISDYSACLTNKRNKTKE
ncbi:hypothetical protein I3259_19495 [Photobacterium sp. Ph5]|nr:hypothetical protein [Photobacterium sp. Ph6]MCG3877754.1 hypothetical protein [Photobacterium sp. Ph5]